MLKTNGNGEIIISKPKTLLTIVSLLLIFSSLISYSVGQANSIRQHEDRLNVLDMEMRTLDDTYMDRRELAATFKLVGEQMNRIEQKIDLMRQRSK